LKLCAGEGLAADQQAFSFVLDEPNTWLILMEYLLNPELLSEYITTNCASVEVCSATHRMPIRVKS
jgi:hypothetical protein